MPDLFVLVENFGHAGAQDHFRADDAACRRNAALLQVVLNNVDLDAFLFQFCDIVIRVRRVFNGDVADRDDGAFLLQRSCHDHFLQGYSSTNMTRSAVEAKVNFGNLSTNTMNFCINTEVGTVFGTHALYQSTSLLKG